MSDAAGPIAARSVFAPALLPVTVPILVTVSLAAFDAVAVIAALPVITADLGGIEVVSWVVTSFLLTSAVATLAAGPVIDTLGLRATFRVTVIVFMLASVACAAAPNVVVLIVARAAQGVGGGLAVAVSLAAVGLVFPRHLHSRGFAANSVVWGGMAVAGPALAAGLVSTVGWRAIFLINVPLCIGAVTVGWHRFGGTQRRVLSPVRFDARGLVVLTAFTGVTLVGLSALDIRAVLALGAAAVLITVYWWHAGRSDAPILERRFVATMPFAALNAANGASFGAALGLNTYLPVFVRGGLGQSATVAALSVLFLSVGWTTASLVTSRILDSRSETTMVLVGYAFVVPGMLGGLLLYDATTAPSAVFALVTLTGLGIGTISTSSLTLLQAVTEPASVGRATATHQYLRTIAFSYGAALVASILLLVVQQKGIDVGPIRELLAGEEIETEVAARAAVASGYRWSHAPALAVVGGGLAAAIVLHRWTAR